MTSRGLSGHGKDKTRFKDKEFIYKIKTKHKFPKYNENKPRNIIWECSFIWAEWSEEEIYDEI